jgi:hypothetical protein
MQPWQFFHAARRSIGAATVAHIFNRSIRSAHDWAQDPVYTQVRCRSPLEHLHTLFERMADAGRGYAVRSALQYLERALDPEIEANLIVEPRTTINEEILRDYSAVGQLQQAIESRADVATVNKLMKEAVDEIERTGALYCKNVTDGGGEDYG